MKLLHSVTTHIKNVTKFQETHSAGSKSVSVGPIQTHTDVMIMQLVLQNNGSRLRISSEKGISPT